jgi:hypothetical protein
MSHVAAKGIGLSSRADLLCHLGERCARMPPRFSAMHAVGGVKTERLTEAARRISRRRNVRSRRRRSGICGNLGWRRLWQANPHIHFQVLFGAARTKGFACVFIAQAGQFVAAVDAVAISGRRGRLDRYQSHGICPLFCRIVQVPQDFRKVLTENGRGISTLPVGIYKILNCDRRYGFPIFSRNSVQRVAGMARNTSTTLGSN